MTIVTAWFATDEAIIAPRLTGEDSIVSMTPRSMSSMNPMPLHPLVNSTVMTTTPGMRKSMYVPPPKPGTSTTRLNSWPNSSNQIIGWISMITTNAGCRPVARSRRPVKYPVCATMVLIGSRLLRPRRCGRCTADRRRPATAGRR